MAVTATAGAAATKYAFVRSPRPSTSSAYRMPEVFPPAAATRQYVSTEKSRIDMGSLLTLATSRKSWGIAVMRAAACSAVRSTPDPSTTPKKRNTNSRVTSVVPSKGRRTMEAST